MNPRGVPTGVCIIDLPDGATQMLFQYKHVVVPDSDSPGHWRRSWKLVPVCCQVKATNWFSKDAHRRAAATERAMWAAGWMADNGASRDF